MVESNKEFCKSKVNGFREEVRQKKRDEDAWMVFVAVSMLVVFLGLILPMFLVACICLWRLLISLF